MGRRGFSCTHLNSLFKVDDGLNVGSQLDDFLGLRSTVLHHAQLGLIIGKLERKAWHGDLVFWLGCYVCELFFFFSLSTFLRPTHLD